MSITPLRSAGDVPIIELGILPTPEVAEPEELQISQGVSLPWHIYYVNPKSGMNDKFSTSYSHEHIAVNDAKVLIGRGQVGVRVVHITLPPIAY